VRVNLERVSQRRREPQLARRPQRVRAHRRPVVVKNDAGSNIPRRSIAIGYNLGIMLV